MVMVKSLVLFSGLLVTILVAGLVNSNSPKTGPLAEPEDEPIASEKVSKLVEQIAFKSNDTGSYTRLAKVVERETWSPVPNWFNNRIKNHLESAQTKNSLGKPIFRFRTKDHVDFVETEENKISISCEDKEVVADTERIPVLNFREMGRSDFFIGKSTNVGVFVFCDQPKYPLLCINGKGHLVWQASIYKPEGFTRMEIEIVEGDSQLVCFAACDQECLVQSFDKENGAVIFWWSTSLIK